MDQGLATLIGPMVGSVASYFLRRRSSRNQTVRVPRHVLEEYIAEQSRLREEIRELGRGLAATRFVESAMADLARTPGVRVTAQHVIVTPRATAIWRTEIERERVHPLAPPTGVPRLSTNPFRGLQDEIESTRAGR